MTAPKKRALVSLGLLTAALGTLAVFATDLYKAYQIRQLCQGVNHYAYVDYDGTTRIDGVQLNVTEIRDLLHRLGNDPRKHTFGFGFAGGPIINPDQEPVFECFFDAFKVYEFELGGIDL